jgi:hypothetical protein
LAGFVVSQLIAMAVGVIFLAAMRWSKMPFGLLVPAAWLLGNGLLAAQRLLLSQAGLPWNPLTLYLPWLALASAAAWRAWQTGWRPRLPSPAAKWAGLTHRARLALYIEVSALAVIVVWVASLLRATLNQPLAQWDALVIWIFKGRVFYESGAVPVSFLTDPQYDIFTHHLDYPLLVPLSVAHMYSWMGDQEVISKAWWSLLAGAAAAGLYFGLSDIIGRAARLSGLVLLIAMPALNRQAVDLAGYVDLPLAVFFLYGVLFLYRWLRRPSPGEFALSALFFGMAGFIKNEGLVVTLSGLGLLVTVSLLLRRRARPPLLQSLVLASLFVVPWQVQKAALGIKGDLNPTISALLENWQERAGAVAGSLASYATDVNSLNLIWFLLPLLSLAVLIFMPRRWLATLPLVLLVMAHVGGTFVAYVTTPHDLKWHLLTSAERLVFQSALPVALLTVIYVGLLLEAPEPAAAPQEGPLRQPQGDIQTIPRAV